MYAFLGSLSNFRICRTVSSNPLTPLLLYKLYHIDLILAHKERLVAGARGGLDLQMIRRAIRPSCGLIHAGVLEICLHLTGVIRISKVGEIPFQLCEARVAILHT